MESDFSGRLWKNSPLVSRTQAQNLQTRGQSTPSAPVKNHTPTEETQKYSTVLLQGSTFWIFQTFFLSQVISSLLLQDIYPPSRHNLVQTEIAEICWNCFHVRLRLLGTWRDPIFLLEEDRQSTLVGKERALVTTRKASLEFNFGSK